MQVKHFAKIHYAGAFVSEVKIIEIEVKEIKRVRIPENALGVTLFDKITDEIEYEGQKIELESKEIGKIYYPVGKVWTLEDVAKEYGKDSIAYGNMENNGYKYAIMSKSGSLNFLDEADKDRVIDPDTLEDEDERDI